MYFSIFDKDKNGSKNLNKVFGCISSVAQADNYDTVVRTK